MKDKRIEQFDSMYKSTRDFLKENKGFEGKIGVEEKESKTNKKYSGELNKRITIPKEEDEQVYLEGDNTKIKSDFVWYVVFATVFGMINLLIIIGAINIMIYFLKSPSEFDNLWLLIMIGVSWFCFKEIPSIVHYHINRAKEIYNILE